MGKKNKDSSQPSLNSPFKASATSRACAYVGILHALKTGPCSSRCSSPLLSISFYMDSLISNMNYEFCDF